MDDARPEKTITRPFNREDLVAEKFAASVK